MAEIGDDIQIHGYELTIVNVDNHITVPAENQKLYLVGDFNGFSLSGAPSFSIVGNNCVIDLREAGFLDGVNRLGLKDFNGQAIWRGSFSIADTELIYRQTDASSSSGAGDWVMAVMWDTTTDTASFVPEGELVVYRSY